MLWIEPIIFCGETKMPDKTSKSSLCKDALKSATLSACHTCISSLTLVPNCLHFFLPIEKNSHCHSIQPAIKYNSSLYEPFRVGRILFSVGYHREILFNFIVFLCLDLLQNPVLMRQGILTGCLDSTVRK